MAELYDQIGRGYAVQRKPDPRIYQLLRSHLNGRSSVVNVGAGAGSYEPVDLPVIAVEPSQQMIAQRANRANVVQAKAEALPLRNACADVVMAVLTIHHWSDKKKGLEECARVARRQVSLLTWDPESEGFWLIQDYFPELLELDRAIFPTMKEIQSTLGAVSIKPIPIPADCVDGFLGAYWQRPSAYLDAKVRSGMSSFSRIPNVEERVKMLQQDIVSGAWQRRHASLRLENSLDIGYRLVSAAIQ